MSNPSGSPGFDPWTLFSADILSTTGPCLTWTSVQRNFFKYKQYYCSKTWLSHFRRARRFVVDDTRGLYETAVNWIQHTFRTSRVLLCNFLRTPDFPKLSGIRISYGPWNRKFSAPSSPSSKLENCVHPPKIALNLGFVRRKVFLRKGVRPAPVPFPLFFKSLRVDLNPRISKICASWMSVWNISANYVLVNLN